MRGEIAIVVVARLDDDNWRRAARVCSGFFSLKPACSMAGVRPRFGMRPNASACVIRRCDSMPTACSSGTVMYGRRRGVSAGIDLSIEFRAIQPAMSSCAVPSLQDGHEK
jgi:hypothetical protein